MNFPVENEESGVNTKLLVRLKNKESITGLFRGEPHSFRQHWVGNRSQNCPGATHCELCKGGEKASFRFRINFLTKVQDQYTMLIWEQGWTVYNDLKALNEGGYSLDKTLVKITRHGEGKNDTSYSVLPVPGGQINSQQEKAFSGVALNDLKSLDKAEELQAPVEEPRPFFGNEEDVPF